MLNPLANGKIQVLFKALSVFSSTFQGKFDFQGLFKTVLYFQVLFKPVRTLINHENLVPTTYYHIYGLIFHFHVILTEIVTRDTHLRGSFFMFVESGCISTNIEFTVP